MKHRARSARHEESEPASEPEQIPVVDDAADAAPEPPVVDIPASPEAPAAPEPPAAPVAAAPEPDPSDWCPRCKEERLRPKLGAPYRCARCHDRF